MECKDVLGLVASYGQMALQGGVLWATIYFYKQLVDNDNRREQRAVADQRRRDDDVIKKWTKDIFRSAGNAGGQLQSAGERLRAKFPDAVPVILAAYEELQVEEPGLRLPQAQRFLELMDGVERGHWPAWHEWAR